MESKLLIGGRNIMDHTNEQQKMLELKRQEIAEQVGLGLWVPGGAGPGDHISGAQGLKPSWTQDPCTSAENLTHTTLDPMGPPAQGLPLARVLLAGGREKGVAQHDVSFHSAPCSNSRAFQKGASSLPTVRLCSKSSRTTIGWSDQSTVIYMGSGWGSREASVRDVYLYMC